MSKKEKIADILVSTILNSNGGQGWIRTTESGAGRFTVCSLWPLGNLPILINGAGDRN